jgi:IS30 family transposase
MPSGIGRGRRLSNADRAEIRARIHVGEQYRAVAAVMGCAPLTVQQVVARYGGVASRMRPRPAIRLAAAEREELSRGLLARRSLRQIAAQLGRAPSTIAREVRGNGGRCHYRAWQAERRAERRLQRPKVAKLVRRPALRAVVAQGLAQYWSPQQIARRLRIDYPGQAEMYVSHETIYQSLFVQGRGALRRELTRYLRTQRTKRRPRQRGVGGPGQLREMVLISARPAEVADRAVPGHWEGDLLLGKRGLSAIGTLVERQTRFVMLFALPTGRHAEQVRERLAAKITELPIQLRRSLTWDQGKEMAEHRQFTIDTGVQVYFCDPHSPWQRGANENTNGLLRQYFPKGTVLSGFSAAELDAVAAQLNGRPRQTLGWMKPSEAFARAVAMTA